MRQSRPKKCEERQRERCTFDFFLFVLSDESYRPAGLGGAGPSSILSPLENNAGGGNPSTSILTTNGGMSPPPPLFPAISAGTAPSHTVQAPSCTVQARPDTNWCLCVLCAILRRSSTIRHHLLVSGRGLRLPVPFEHDQTPIAGVWPCSAPSCTVRALGVWLCSAPSRTVRA